MWDIRQIIPAEGPEKTVPLQEARHTMKNFPKRPGTQSPQCFCCWCWIRFFHMLSLKAGFLLHQLPLSHSFPFPVISKELRGRWDELLLPAPLLVQEEGWSCSSCRVLDASTTNSPNSPGQSRVPRILCSCTFTQNAWPWHRTWHRC